MVMHNPPHPGGVIREFCIEPLGLSVKKAAEGLGVSRASLSDVYREHEDIFRPNRWTDYYHFQKRLPFQTSS